MWIKIKQNKGIVFLKHRAWTDNPFSSHGEITYLISLNLQGAYYTYSSNENNYEQNFEIHTSF